MLNNVFPSACGNGAVKKGITVAATVASIIEATNGGAAFFESILANKHKCWLAKMLSKNAAPPFASIIEANANAADNGDGFADANADTNADANAAADKGDGFAADANADANDADNGDGFAADADDTNAHQNAPNVSNMRPKCVQNAPKMCTKCVQKRTLLCARKKRAFYTLFAS
jgi:hypothetical protein